MALLDVEFVSRGYELDSRGLVPPHVLLRYMEHLRWEYARRRASSVASLLRKDRAFVVAAQTLAIAGDIGMAVSIHAAVWIGRTGRSSIEFHHTFHRVADGTLLSEGCATVVCIGDSGFPVPLPDRLRHTDSGPPLRMDLKPPEFVASLERPFERFYRVRADDVDMLQHVNQANYAAFYDDARQAAAGNGIYGPGDRGGGRIRLLHIDYASSALPGEELAVGTWLIGADPLTLGFTMRRGDTLLSRAVARM
jgi:acyl-CoA thioesterase FadM